MTTPCAFPAQPIADAVAKAPVIASFAAFGAQSDFFGRTDWSTTVLAVGVAPVDVDVESACFEDPPSHADARHATTTTPIRSRAVTGA